MPVVERLAGGASAMKIDYVVRRRDVLSGEIVYPAQEMVDGLHSLLMTVQS